MLAPYFAIGLRVPYRDGYLFQLKVAYYLPPFLGDKLRAVITNNLGPLARHALKTAVISSASSLANTNGTTSH